jgi:hypothetical protein
MVLYVYSTSLLNKSWTREFLVLFRYSAVKLVIIPDLIVSYSYTGAFFEENRQSVKLASIKEQTSTIEYDFILF